MTYLFTFAVYFYFKHLIIIWKRKRGNRICCTLKQWNNQQYLQSTNRTKASMPTNLGAHNWGLGGGPLMGKLQSLRPFINGWMSARRLRSAQPAERATCARADPATSQMSPRITLSNRKNALKLHCYLKINQSLTPMKRSHWSKFYVKQYCYCRIQNTIKVASVLNSRNDKLAPDASPRRTNKKIPQDKSRGVRKRRINN